MQWTKPVWTQLPSFFKNHIKNVYINQTLKTFCCVVVVVLCVVVCLFVSPWYNRNGWLGVKHKVNILFVVICCWWWGGGGVLLHCPLREIRLSWVRHSSRRSSANHSYQCVQYFRVSKQSQGCIYIYIYMDTTRESALKADSGRRKKKRKKKAPGTRTRVSIAPGFLVGRSTR